MSIIHLSVLTSKSRNRVTTVRLTGANGFPLNVTMPVSTCNFTTEQAFVVVNALTVDCLLLGVDYLAAWSYHYKHGCALNKDSKIPFTLKSGVATTSNPSTCNRIILVLNVITIPCLFNYFMSAYTGLMG